MPKRRTIRRQARTRAAWAEPIRRNRGCPTSPTTFRRNSTPPWRNIRRYARPNVISCVLFDWIIWQNHKNVVGTACTMATTELNKNVLYLYWQQPNNDNIFYLHSTQKHSKIKINLIKFKHIKLNIKVRKKSKDMITILFPATNFILFHW